MELTLGMVLCDGQTPEGRVEFKSVSSAELFGGGPRLWLLAVPAFRKNDLVRTFRDAGTDPKVIRWHSSAENDKDLCQMKAGEAAVVAMHDAVVTPSLLAWVQRSVESGASVVLLTDDPFAHEIHVQFPRLEQVPVTVARIEPAFDPWVRKAPSEELVRTARRLGPVLLTDARSNDRTATWLEGLARGDAPRRLDDSGVPIFLAGFLFFHRGEGRWKLPPWSRELAVEAISAHRRAAK